MANTHETNKALTAANAVSHPKPETAPSPEGGAITSESAANAIHPQATELACDRSYLNGLRAGFGYGISGDEAGYKKSANSYRAMLAAAPEAKQ